MPLIVLGSFFFGVLLTWFILQRKYKMLIKETVVSATTDISTKLDETDANLKAATQKVADLEYTIREREKDIAALKSKRD